MFLIFPRALECSNTIRNVISSKNDSKSTKMLQTKISPFKFGSIYAQKWWRHQKWVWSTKKRFLPKCSKINSRKSQKFQKGLMKNKKIGRPKTKKRDLLLDPSSPELGRFKEGNGFFSSKCWFAGLCLLVREFVVDCLTIIFQRFLAVFCRIPVK